MPAIIYGPDVSLGELAMTIAMAELGVKEDPPDSNRGDRVDLYLRAARLDPTKGSYPWCAAFVTWAVGEAVLRLAGRPRFAGSASVLRLLEKNWDLVIPEPERAAVFIHLAANGQGHTGFVTRSNRDGSIGTLEGNTNYLGSRTGGMVMSRKRPPGYAYCYLRLA